MQIRETMSENVKSCNILALLRLAMGEAQVLLCFRLFASFVRAAVA